MNLTPDWLALARSPGVGYVTTRVAPADLMRLRGLMRNWRRDTVPPLYVICGYGYSALTTVAIIALVDRRCGRWEDTVKKLSFEMFY